MRPQLLINSLLALLAAGLLSQSAHAVIVSLTPADVGNPAVAGSAIPAGNGYTITGGGTNIAGASDQFFFNYQEITGDFDLKLRVEGLSLTDLWSKAGLMARETLATNSRHASALATPNLSGCFFLSRAISNTVAAGSFPVAYPNTWLRLRRVGSTFTGYAGLDGQAWAQLGTVTLTSPSNTFFVGMAVTSASGSSGTTAQIRDYMFVTGGTIGNVPLRNEPPGPSSRNTGLVISEIMYHPKTSNLLEFIELFNAGLIDENLSGYRISGDVDYVFPAGTIIRPGALLVVARDPAALQATNGISGVLGPWDAASTNAILANALPDDEGTVRLRNRAGAVLLEVVYEGQKPWPIAADGAGHSLVLTRPSYGEGDYRAWSASDRIGGSPGSLDPASADPLRAVVINEFLAHTDDPLFDYVELYNYGNQPVDLSGAYLSDDRDTNKFRIPNGTPPLPPRGFISFNQNELGFSLSSGGERLYLVNSNQTRVIDAIVFGAQANGVASGRYPDGAPAFHELASRTPGQANSALLIRDVVINEIMYNPISGRENDEYIELYNRGANPVNVGDWRFTDGIDFRIPAGTIIAPNGYLVIAENVTNLLARYSQLNSTNTLGNYGGTLANGGERIALAMPDTIITTNTNTMAITTNLNYIVVDEVIYLDSGRWTQWSDGGGSSLELMDAKADNSLAANWADSDETAKSEWTTVNHKEQIDNIYPRGSPGDALNEVQVMILGKGEALIDDVEVHSENPTTGPNLVANGTFTSGTTGWAIQGNHIQSGLEPAGPNNPSQSLRIRASSGGDNGANRVETDLTSALAVNTPASLRGRFRWLRGHPDVLMRLHGGGLEVVTTLKLPGNLGTPGLPNSRLLANAGPAIYEVNHTPALPAAGQPVIVTARVSDTDGVGAVQLRYRQDPSATLTDIPMLDDGTGGDAVANDGIYSATLPGLPGGTMVAFRVQATDAVAPTPASTVFPPDAPARECLVRFGDPTYAGNLGVYRIWMTSVNTNAWTTRERLSNEALDGTFVYNNYRVIYSAGARYRGSPFIRPGYTSPFGSACGYVWILPEDDQLLGQDELNLDSLEPQGRDSTALREITSFSILEDMDWPTSYQRFVHVVLNGINNTSRNIPVYTDSQQPNSSYISSWYPENADGDIYKIDDWFEFTDSPIGMQANKCASLQTFLTTGGAKKQARYRWNWEKKFNRTLNDDYSTLFEAATAMNAQASVYVQQMEAVFDTEEWLGTIAFRHLVGDWDGYGYNRGKNQFCYRPNGRKFQMLMWDLDFALGCNGGHGPSQDLFSIALEGDAGQNHMPEMNRMYNTLQFRRSYLRSLLRMANGPLQDAAFLPTLDARYRALQANGVASVSPYVSSGAQGISIPAWLQQRRTYILGNSGVGPFSNATFNVSSPLSITTNGNLISISGTAQLLVKDINLNGIAWPVTWTSVTSWTARVVLDAGSNGFQIAGTDLTGKSITSTQTVVANFTGDTASPEGAVVFNEIQYNPAIPEASFVEFYNRTSLTLDIGGWRVNGLDYTFPEGSIMTGGQYIVLAKSLHAMSAAHTTNAVIFGVFDGNLDPDGETLTLLKPGTNGNPDLVIDRVRYEAAAPWPVPTVTGPSLQLADVEQDNARVSNWGSGFGWQRVTRTGNIANATNLLLWINTPGNCYIDDISLTSSNGVDAVVNGGFETGSTDPWIVGTNYQASTVVNTISHSGTSSLFLQGAANGGNFPQHVLQQNIAASVQASNLYTLTFYVLYNTNSVTVQMRSLPGNNITTNVATAPILATPGLLNLFVTTLPAYDPLWLNEVQPGNVNGITDNNGERDPWIELYNGGTNALDLSGYYLADNYDANLLQWQFPAGSSIAPGEFKVVWADGQPTQTSGTNLHTSFRLASSSGSVALVRIVDGSPQITDYLNYFGVGPNLSYGDYPDGQPFNRVVMFNVTPGRTNVARNINVFVNEWMAGNTNFIADPAGALGLPEYDDWFELYNAGTEPVDIGGYYLTDNLNNRNQFRVPTNGQYVIPPNGFLLVWADNQTGQNDPGVPDLHVNFQLSRTGESIGLHAPDGQTVIDTVSFGNQTNDVSQGRFADGASAPYYFMTTPTPAARNTIGGANNNPPTLAPIADRFVTPGQTVSFVASASDPDVGQSLLFNLQPGFPAGASIHPSTGLFQWAISSAQPPGTSAVTVRVADNGVPQQSAPQTFNIIVAAPATVSVSGNTVSLGFPVIAGKNYRIEYKNTLTDASWTLLKTEVATSSLLAAVDTLSGSPQRFYRIVQLD